MAQTNEELLQELIRDGYLKSPLLIEAFRAIDRKDFVPKELWNEAYGNYPLPIGEGQTISQPLTVAFMLELLQPKPGEKILDVGSGSGWTSALLAYCVNRAARINADTYADKRGKNISVNQRSNQRESAGYIVAVERVSELCKMGEANIRKYNFIEKGIVKTFCGDASQGMPLKFLSKGRPSTPPTTGRSRSGNKQLFPACPPKPGEGRELVEGTCPELVEGFDKILSGAAAQAEIPEAWKKQLKIGGRIVAPVESSVVVFDKISEVEFHEKEYFGFSFVPLVRG